MISKVAQSTAGSDWGECVVMKGAMRVKTVNARIVEKTVGT